MLFTHPLLIDYWFILHSDISISFNKLMSQISIQNNPHELLNAFFAAREYSSVACLPMSIPINIVTRLFNRYCRLHSMITIPAGEEHKNLESCKLVWEKLN